MTEQNRIQKQQRRSITTPVSAMKNTAKTDKATKQETKKAQAQIPEVTPEPEPS